MAFGLGVLRLPPEAFWAMTLPEMQTAISGLLGPTSHDRLPTGAELKAMMARFPDAGSAAGSRQSDIRTIGASTRGSERRADRNLDHRGRGGHEPATE
ncbi:MAG: phage tail assembly chaperone [Hyphomicrobium sp.]